MTSHVHPCFAHLFWIMMWSFFFFKTLDVCMYTWLWRIKRVWSVKGCHLKIQKFCWQLFYLKMAVVRAGLRLLEAFISMFALFCFFCFVKARLPLVVSSTLLWWVDLSQLPTLLLACCPSSIAQREKIKQKSLCVELKPGISLTNYWHGQTRLYLGKINLI